MIPVVSMMTPRAKTLIRLRGYVRLLQREAEEFANTRPEYAAKCLADIAAYTKIIRRIEARKAWEWKQDA